MATYAIGDIQGCFDDFRRLLDRIAFDPDIDRLWLVGDLVNRGPRSLDVLRHVKALGTRVVCVLGNHDLHLLALSQGNCKHYRDDSLDPILMAPDRDELLDWLRHRPLMHHDAELEFSMVHAGIPPQWNIGTALARAAEVESVLRGVEFSEFCHNMYGNKPARWSDDLEGWRRLRFITNSFTRLRYCDPSGRLALKAKGPPGSQMQGYLPWFRIEGRASQGSRIVFGHWSTLGYLVHDRVYALDTGCVWGGQLTALRLGTEPVAMHLDCPGARTPKSD